MSIGLAIKAFFAVLFRAEVADKVRKALAATSTLAKYGEVAKAVVTPQTSVTQEPPSSAPALPATIKATRNDALTLLSTLQREARFLDLVCQPVEGFDDVQIGAAAREVIRDCQKALARMFGIEPLSSDDEGARCTLPVELSAVQYRVVGKASQSPPSGIVVHRGWKATRCQLPTWTGSNDECTILAPIEVEIG